MFNTLLTDLIEKQIKILKEDTEDTEKNKIAIEQLKRLQKFIKPFGFKIL